MLNVIRAVIRSFRAQGERDMTSNVSAGVGGLSVDALVQYDDRHKYYSDYVDDSKIVSAVRIVWCCVGLVWCFLVWSYFAEVVEVSSGSGRVIPSSREQIIESLEGGILKELYVSEGDIVEVGKILAQLDLTKTESKVEESAARYRATTAKVARLEAEVNDSELTFPDSLNDYPALKARETRLYKTRRKGLSDSLAGIQKSMRLVREELVLTRSLADIGAASNVEVLRLERQLSELELKASEKRSEYMILAREELATAKAEADSLQSVVRGRADELSRLTVRSPVQGIVKNIEVTTKGGVVPPNGQLMEIVPMDGSLLIEAKISPRDIAYIRPGQPAKVKITAYDYTVYGDLDGQVSVVSPDTTQDEVNPEIFYYHVFIRTDADFLENDVGAKFYIVPGMVATVDIRTGEKTVFDYLMKPINHAREALRER